MYGFICKINRIISDYKLPLSKQIMAQTDHYYLGNPKRTWIYHDLYHSVLCRRQVERLRRELNYGNT